MPNIPSERLYDLAFLIARAMGSSETEARDVAEHLVAANLAGHDSHGIGMFPDYVRMLHAGLLVPNQTLELVADRGGVLVLDAKRGFGQAMAKEAMRRGIERAKQNGSVVVALRNSAHVGRIGHWAEQCCAAGMVSIHFVNVGDHDPLQAPYACSDARLGTNPFAVGVPGPDGKPLLLLDMATSAIAFGKARVARNKGVPVPEGVLIDEHGRPTTDPTIYVDTRKGALLAFGGHKGSGLAILCEVLGAAVTGGMTIAPHHARQDGIVNSMLSFVLDASAVGDPMQIARETLAVGDWIKASPPAPGFTEVLLPGEPEQRSRERRLAEGVPIDDKSLADILAAARSLGLSDAELDRALGR
ncbi:malate/lactate/ureidoglycolate dehydrogenase [Benzoatithermus flavus]|uniref:Malate/lactate/ureidoglycolate dehydrogenase n=1 Tax=Benzoatithermus flavus TaxID=3108223 RepID=A0ABU8XSI5_9PROT